MRAAVLEMTSLPAAAVASTVSSTMSVSLWPASRSGRVQVGLMKAPALGVNESTATPGGRERVSLMVTLLASEGPALVAVMV